MLKFSLRHFVAFGELEGALRYPAFTGGANGLQMTEWCGVSVPNLYSKCLKKKISDT